MQAALKSQASQGTDKETEMLCLTHTVFVAMCSGTEKRVVDNKHHVHQLVIGLEQSTAAILHTMQ